MSPAEQNPLEARDAAQPEEGKKKSLPAPGGSAISLTRSLRRHRILAAAVAVLILAAGLPVAWKKGVPVYSTTAVVYVSPHFVANLQDGKEVEAKSDNQYHDYIQQNAKTINRFDIVFDALQRLGARKSTWLNKPGETVEHAAERLQGALTIVPVLDTYQITVSLESTRKDGLADIVNGVVNGFIRSAKSEEFFASDERVKNLTVDRTRLEGEIEERQAKRLELAQELGVSSFTENFVNPYDRLLVGAKEALAAAQRLNIDAMAQLAAVSEKERKGGGEALQAEAEIEAGRDTSLTSLEATQNGRRALLMSSISGLSAEHPGRRAAERELAEMDKELQSVTERLVKSWSKSILDQRDSEAYKTNRVVQQLTAEVNQQASQAMYYTRNYQDGVQLGVEIEAARKRIDSLQERIDFLSLEKKRARIRARVLGGAAPQPSGEGRTAQAVRDGGGGGPAFRAGGAGGGGLHGSAPADAAQRGKRSRIRAHCLDVAEGGGRGRIRS